MPDHRNKTMGLNVRSRKNNSADLTDSLSLFFPSARAEQLGEQLIKMPL